MKILVTGNKGFIASYLIQKLNILFPTAEILGFDKEEYFNHSYHIFKQNEYDYIFHLAAIARTAECTDDPYGRSFESNVMLTRDILKNFKFKKLIYSSSCALYGNQYSILHNTPMRIDENTFPNPLSVYASQKLFSENLIHFSLKNRNVSSTCLRLFNTYGNKQSQMGSYPNVIASMIKSYKKNGCVEVTGDGTQTRNFVHVLDVSDALIKSLFIQGNDIFNIAGHDELNMNQLAYLITKDEFKIKHIAERPFDIKFQNHVSSEKFRNLVGWKSYIGIEQGIDEILKYEGLK